GRYAPGPIGVQAEVLYAQKGSQLDDGSVRWRADYVEVPVLVAVRGPAIRSLDPTLLVGVAGAVPIRGTASADAVDNVPATEVDLDLQPDVGVVVGIEVGPGPVGIGLRYTHGLRNVIDGSDLLPNQTVVPWKNRVIAVTAHVRLTR
ncbi:MAG: outer membrane beta-barrel protein, partial [Bacteroidota bacterium]